ncbi:DNA replication checkpoint mediator, MRC1 domain protein [Metarhizium rileyi]|uniref:DNA replication checkpoint mediator, MRC1 domain protein n=1 Tax=Metarhizium rileyi (strain RCEF 4871) TaxID=1649241 RepID=A0A167G301_METRR|nr:DNA replication checkpoint mediator, MRC1 domain protein [Metarhizium rileyi RCEF 4871]
MAPPRVSSPVSRGGSREPLTPRSKIRALLATVESSDDEEVSQSRDKTANSSLISQLPRKMHSSPRSGRDGESDDSDIAIRPRGKLASRMQGDRINNESTSRSPAVPKTARERVKAMLQREQGKQDEDAANGDDEDDGLPTAPRRLQRRAPVEDESGSAERTPRSESPGLFVSSPIRPSPGEKTAQVEDSDNDLPSLKSDRFKALVERKRQERLAREEAEKISKAERRAQQEKLASELEQLVSDDDLEGITDDEGGRRLTQEARPTRKASRKAIEEMNRETQRMARSMQLAHEAKTKKKISKTSLFERFNYKPIGGIGTAALVANSSSRPTTPQSDVEMDDADTPPSSPPFDKHNEQPATANSAVPINHPEIAARPEVVREASLMTTSVEAGQPEKPKRRVRVRLPKVSTDVITIDSDDELQVTKTAKHKIDALFANIPSKKPGEVQSLHIFRALAQVKSPGKEGRGKKDQSKMTPGELQTYLQLKARQQAKLERDRRLEILKGQGIMIQTAEERERQEQEVEDIVAKARQEAHKIMEEEKGEAKRQQKESGDVDPLAWDDSDDEEYQDLAEEADAEASEMELSGSEDEAEVDNAEGDEGTRRPLFDDEAALSASEGEMDAQDDDADEVEQPALRQRIARNKVVVLSDDEGEVEATPKPVQVATQTTPAGASMASPVAPGSVLRSARKTFIPGLPVQGPAGLGLTQIFAGTMDSQMSDSADGPTQSMMPDFDHFPDSNFSATMDSPIEDVIIDSQREETQKIQLNLSQSQMHGLGTLTADVMQTQMSEMMDYSQDVGLQQHTPLRDRFIDPPCSTVETMIADKQDEDASQVSPLVRKGRLRRRMDMSIAESAIPEASEPSTPSTQGNAFRAMQDAAKKEKRLRLNDDFDRKKSKAKEMIAEQAEESEDEYAGLGGVDGEDSDDDSNGSVEEMIDDTAGNDNDERKLAAFYADRERAMDEQQVEKLFKDITTGMLRRKRGADFDLSDSDSDGEARKRMKRRQFAKMQKALFADERVKKIAENPGNQAFLRTIEDRGSDDELDVLGVLESPSQAEADSPSQEDTQEEQSRHPATIPDSQPTHEQRPLSTAADNARAPASMRRTKNGKKPSNIGEVRETLSDLLDEQRGSIIPATEAGSDSEEEAGSDDASRSDKENHQPVVDRISLKRTASGTSSTIRMAFTTQAASSSSSSSSSFKVPALLRRATTNSTLMSGSSGNPATGSAGGFGEEAKIKKGAGKRSGIGGFAREKEQRGPIQESERRRQERRMKGAKGRIGLVGGILGKGTFG